MTFDMGEVDKEIAVKRHAGYQCLIELPESDFHCLVIVAFFPETGYDRATEYLLRITPCDTFLRLAVDNDNRLRTTVLDNIDKNPDKHRMNGGIADSAAEMHFYGDFFIRYFRGEFAFDKHALEFCRERFYRFKAFENGIGEEKLRFF